MTEPTTPVLLYDGTCALCNGFVRLIMRHDPGARIRFAPLQSEAARELLASRGLPTERFDSLVFVPDWNRRASGALLLRTDGALAAFAELRGPWRAVSWLRPIPPFMRDPVYRLVARVRHALFGDYKPTPLPVPLWEKRFIAR